MIIVIIIFEYFYEICQSNFNRVVHYNKNKHQIIQWKIQEKNTIF
jgi:hypothetical protein